MTEIINTPVSYFDNSGKFGLCLFAVSRSIRFLDFFYLYIFDSQSVF